MPVKLVAADMDGTLLDSKSQIPPGLFDLIIRLYDHGIRFAAASGRQYYNLLKLFAPVKDKIIFIAENGGMVFDGEKQLFVQNIPPDDLRNIVALARSIPNAYTLICGTRAAYSQDNQPQFMSNAAKYYAHLDLVPDQLALLNSEEFCKVAVFHTDAEHYVLPVMNRLKQNFLVSLSGVNWVDVMRQGVNKGTAIRRIQSMLKISAMETMAFGDYMNDLEMMRECHYSCAVANAHPDLKANCNYQLPLSNDEYGVIKVLNKLLEKPEDQFSSEWFSV